MFYRGLPEAVSLIVYEQKHPLPGGKCEQAHLRPFLSSLPPPGMTSFSVPGRPRLPELWCPEGPVDVAGVGLSIVASVLASSAVLPWFPHL